MLVTRSRENDGGPSGQVEMRKADARGIDHRLKREIFAGDRNTDKNLQIVSLNGGELAIHVFLKKRSQSIVHILLWNSLLQGMCLFFPARFLHCREGGCIGASWTTMP